MVILYKILSSIGFHLGTSTLLIIELHMPRSVSLDKQMKRIVSVSITTKNCIVVGSLNWFFWSSHFSFELRPRPSNHVIHLQRLWHDCRHPRSYFFCVVKCRIHAWKTKVSTLHFSHGTCQVFHRGWECIKGKRARRRGKLRASLGDTKTAEEAWCHKLIPCFVLVG